MKAILFTAAVVSLVSTISFADDGFKVGNFKNPSKEVLNCSVSKLVTGKGSVLSNSKTIDVSIPGPYGPNTAGVRSETILETDGLKVIFGTYDADIEFHIIPSNAKDDSNNYLAHAATSLGPIRDSRDEKLFMTYHIPGTDAELMASCSYVQYVDTK
jgi:hypothetical protein